MFPTFQQIFKYTSKARIGLLLSLLLVDFRVVFINSYAALEDPKFFYPATLKSFGLGGELTIVGRKL